MKELILKMDKIQLPRDELISFIDNLTDLYSDELKDKAKQWVDRYPDAIVHEVNKTGDGCICIEYKLDGLDNQFVVFETKRIILWNLVGNVRKNYRRVKYLT